MSKLKLFLAVVLCLSLIIPLGANAFDKMAARNPDLVKQFANPGKAPQPSRDEDELMTLRFMYSADAGMNWSEIIPAGDPGMYEIDGEDTVSAWGSASYDFGSIVDLDNYLHFVVILDAFNEEPGLNPYDRVNGLYDVKTDMDGAATYTLIAATGDDAFAFSDVGMCADGYLYATWVKVVTPEEGDPYAELMASKSMDAGESWSDPIMIADGLDITHNYPHITPHVGEYYYVIYEMPNPETALYDHYVVKAPASMEGDAEVQATGVASAVYYSYYVGANSPIDQDVADGYVYFTVRNEDASATAVANSDGGGDWTAEQIDGFQRYPSMMLWPDAEVGGTPWVFSNFGPSDPGTYHKNWYSFDGLGYNGGDWLPQTVLDSVMYDGARDLLYCHNGVVTTEGCLVSGCNTWGQFTPEGYRVKVSEDMGESWSEGQQLWSIFDEPGLRGGYITQNQLNAGMNNSVWLAFNGEYGATDFGPPMINNDNITLSSYMLNEPWVVGAEITDALSAIIYADINWTTGDPLDPEAPWAYVEGDSAHVDDNGHGVYFFTLPSDEMFGEPLEDGMEIWFYIFAQDESGNMAGSMESKIVVGREYMSAPEEAIPTQIELGQNYPNPFNNETIIPFSIDRSMDVNLSIFDVNGRLVSTLYNGNASAGRHEVAWQGNGVSSGIYFYVLQTSGQRYISKLTLLR